MKFIQVISVLKDKYAIKTSKGPSFNNQSMELWWSSNLTLVKQWLAQPWTRKDERYETSTAFWHSPSKPSRMLFSPLGCFSLWGFDLFMLYLWGTFNILFIYVFSPENYICSQRSKLIWPYLWVFFAMEIVKSTKSWLSPEFCWHICPSANRENNSFGNRSKYRLLL